MKKNKGLVSIIIINWNGKKWLPKLFESLGKLTYKQIEIVFVDNASVDDSVDWVVRHYPDTVIVKNSKNEGFANANNIGFKFAHGDYIFFLNNDTVIEPDSVSLLVSALEKDPSVGGVQGKLVLMDHPDTLDSVGAYLTPTGFLYHYGFGKKDTPKYETTLDLYTAKGAAMMFPKYILEKTVIDGNIFDPLAFAYFEETDLCHRIWLAGFRIRYVPKAMIFHKMGATSSGMNNAFVQYNSFKNRISSYMRNLGLWHLVTILFLHLLLCVCFIGISCVRGKWSLAGAIINANWWVIKSLPRIFKERNYVQTQIRKVSDEAFWDRIMRTPSIRYYIELGKGNFGYEEGN